MSYTDTALLNWYDVPANGEKIVLVMCYSLAQVWVCR
jgi:hypothetical protein